MYGKGENTGKTDVAETFIWVLVGSLKFNLVLHLTESLA